MTPEQFENFFYETLAQIPAYAYECISYYTKQNGIRLAPEISDNNIDLVEQKHGARYRSAITHVTDDEWRVLFRERLLEAPEPVLRTIITHEAVHAFLSPILHPMKGQKLSGLNLAHAQDYLKRFSEILEKTDIASQEGYTYEEALVVFINQDWGNDEMAANAWVNKHCSQT